MAQESIKIRELPSTGIPPTSADYVVVESLTLGTRKSTIANLNFSSQNFLDGSISGSKIAGDIAGAGLTKTGPNLAVNPDNATIEIAADQLRIKSGGITGGSIADGSLPISKIKAVPTDLTKDVPDPEDSVLIKDGTDGLTKLTTVSEFATVVVGSLPGGTISVDTTLNVGTGQTYALLSDAIDFLSDKNIAPGVTVTIQLTGEVHTLTDTIVIDHPNGQSINIQGQPLIQIPVITYNTSPSAAGNQIQSSAGNNTTGYTVTLQLQPGGTAGLNVDDYIGVEFYGNNRANPITRWGNNVNNNNNYVIFPNYLGTTLSTGDIVSLHYGFNGSGRGSYKIIDWAPGVPTGQPDGYRFNIGDIVTGNPTTTGTGGTNLPSIDTTRGGGPATFSSAPTTRVSDRAAKGYVVLNNADALKGSLTLTNNSNTIQWSPSGSYTDLRTFLNVGDVISGGLMAVRISEIVDATHFRIAVPVPLPSGGSTTVSWTNSGVINTNPACINACARISAVDSVNNRITLEYFIKFKPSSWDTYVDGIQGSNYVANGANANNLQSGNLPFPSNGFSINAWKFPTVLKKAISTTPSNYFATQNLGLLKDVAACTDINNYASQDVKFIDAGIDYKCKYIAALGLGNLGVNGTRFIDASGGTFISTIDNTRIWNANCYGSAITLRSNATWRSSASIYINGCNASQGVSLVDSAILSKITNSSLTVDPKFTINSVYGATSPASTIYYGGDGILLSRGSDFNWQCNIRSSNGLYISQIVRSGLICVSNSTATIFGCNISGAGNGGLSADTGGEINAARSIIGGVVFGSGAYADQKGFINISASIITSIAIHGIAVNASSSINAYDSIVSFIGQVGAPNSGFTTTYGVVVNRNSGLHADRLNIGFVWTGVHVSDHSNADLNSSEIGYTNNLAVNAVTGSKVGIDGCNLTMGQSILNADEKSIIMYHNDIVTGAIVPQTQPNISGFVGSTPTINARKGSLIGIYGGAPSVSAICSPTINTPGTFSEAVIV